MVSLSFVSSKCVQRYNKKAFSGPQFWDQGVLTVLRLDQLYLFKHLPIKNLPLNECFLTFGAFALLFNIAGSYSNVYKATKKKGNNVVQPLIGLLPFVAHSGTLLAWLYGSSFIRTQHLIPFAIFWGTLYFRAEFVVGFIDQNSNLWQGYPSLTK